jgi:hypothetical protein
MYGNQMELFNDGGLMDEGGMIDEVSGNDVPPGSTRKEVRDDIPAMLSEGEFVFPADVVRYFGLERLMEMRQQAKMGLQKMEAMGQMGNSEEATIPDDLPFSPEDLIIMSPQEFNRGGVVQAQQGTFVQPSGFQDSSFNTPNFIPPSSVAPVNPQGTPTGYLPSFVNQSVIQPTGQNETITQPSGTTGTTTGTDFVPTVGDVYTFEKYRNESTGEVRDFPFYMGQPVIPIPDGFVPFTKEETTATEDVTVEDVLTEPQQTVDDADNRDVVFGETTPQGPDISQMNAEELAEAARGVRTMQTMGAAAGLAINPIFGVAMAGAARLQRNAINKRAQELGIESPFSGGFLSGITSTVDDIVGNIRNIFTRTEEEAATQPSRAPATSRVPTVRPESPGMTPAPTRDPFAGMSGADLLPPTTTTTPSPVAPAATQGTSDAGLSVAASMTEAEKEAGIAYADSGSDRDDTWSGGQVGVSQAAKEKSASVQSGSPAAGKDFGGKNISSEKYSGKGYTSGRAKGGFISKPKEQSKLTPNKKRGIAARKKK